MSNILRKTKKFPEEERMYGCTKRNRPFMNPGECKITRGCPYYTSETIEKATQEIKNRISEMQTYKLFSDDDEKYISRDEVLQTIDEKAKECSKWKK